MEKKKNRIKEKIKSYEKKEKGETLKIKYKKKIKKRLERKN